MANNYTIKQTVDLSNVNQNWNVARHDALMYPGDNLAHTWEVQVKRNGIPVDMSGGNVVGYFQRKDGNTVMVNGTITDSVCKVTLAQECYAISGAMRAVMRYTNTSTNIIITLAYHAFTVQSRIDDGGIIDPGEVIPSIDDLLAEIEAMEEVTAAAEAAADAVPDMVAPVFSTSTAYSAGSYIYYDGTLYRFTADHAAGAWNSAQAVAVTVGGEVADLKSQIVNSKSTAIPCSFQSIGTKANLNLEGYSGKKVFVSNKNLLPQFTAMTDHGVTCVKNADGSVTLSGTANGTAVIAITANEMPNLGPGMYALAAGNASAIGDSSTYINVAIDGSYAAIYARLNVVNGKTLFTVPEGSRVTAIRIRITSGVVIPSDYTLFPQIEEGSEYTSFVRHEGYILSPSDAETVADVFFGYNYICAQSGVTGTVTFDTSVIDIVQTEVDALDKRVTALEGKSGKFAGKKIVCFGDSITGNFPAPTDYPSMIAEITGATVYNAGFGGCCMSDNGQTRKDFTMCRLADAIAAGSFSVQRNSGVSITYAGTSTDYVPDRLTMLEGIDWGEIDYITIAYGTNDWNSNYGLDNENDPDDTTTYIGAFRYSVEKLLAAYPNLKILVITPLWRWWDTNTGMPSEIQLGYIDSNDYAKGTGYKLWQYGDALVDAAKWYHIPVLDMYFNCMMNKQNRFQYFNTTDGTHPKLEGRELMAELISAYMESVY